MDTDSVPAVKELWTLDKIFTELLVKDCVGVLWLTVLCLIMLCSLKNHCCVFPVAGLTCVAKFSYDSKWYRAKVVDLGPPGLVTVVYVDYGNTESLPCCDLRKLLHRFLELPPQVVWLA